MRTKMKKRIWLAPATLGVVALATLLAFGLMAANGAQPAAAQDAADCTVNAAATLEDVACSTSNSRATVEFKGVATFVADGEPIMVDVLIADRSGSIRAYINGHVEYDGTDDNRYELTAEGATALGGGAAVGNAAPAPMRFRSQTVSVPVAARGSDGKYAAQSTTISVGGNVYLYSPGAAFTTAISGAPSSDMRDEIADDTPVVSITFLGTPHLGMDGADFNKKLDDDVLAQCYLTSDATDMKLVAEGTDDSDGSGVCPDTNTQSEKDPNPDMMESRSKLVVVTAGGASPQTVPVIGGKENHEVALGTGEHGATIYALVEDAKGNALTGTTVQFTVTSRPSNVRSQIASGPAKKVVSTASDPPSSSEIVVTSPPDGIVNGDAIDMVAVQNLRGSSYRVTITVKAGDLDLGSVVLTKAGKATMLDSGIYDYEKCVNKGTDMTSMSDDMFDMTMGTGDDKCAMVSSPARFPRDGMFAVSAIIKDANGSKVTGDAADWMIKDIAMSEV